MKKLNIELVCLAILINLLCPLTAHASSPPADSVHFCAFDDYERSRRDHPRPAAKRLADLDVGEPRTVRMIYFLPNDWPYRADVVDSMKTAIKQSQTFYLEQMQAHGYGDWTFRIETDAQGEPLVHRVDSQHPYSHYENSFALEATIIEEIEQSFDLDANIYVIVLGTDLLRWRGGTWAGGVGSRETKNGGYVLVASEFSWDLVAHELGHAFGLPHYYSDGAYIMSYGGPSQFPGASTWDRISACSADFLAVHTYFNPGIPTEEGQPPVIELISPPGYPAGSTSVPVRLQVSDSEGLYQLAIPPARQFCHGLAGKTSAVVEIDYDGFYFWSAVFIGLGEEPSHGLFAKAVDAEGNLSKFDFTLAEISPYEIATLEGHTIGVTSVAFSPDGTLLASGSQDFETGQGEDRGVRLWDVAGRKEIAALETHGDPVRSVSFSPDGALLASSGTVWDVAGREEIATLKGGPTVFSPDGALLANGVRLWDVAGREEIAKLEGHTSWVRSVSFSPDGALLASASQDSTVRLWDVASREEIATLKGHTAEVTSVAFSPDGALLASGGGWGEYTVRLWDVATQEQVAILKGDGAEVTSVAFSPGGTLLVSGTREWDHKIQLWDVSTGRIVAGFSGHLDGVTSVSFSPDGALLASGSWDRTVKLWDVSEWTGPRPFALEILSGDGQQGTPGAPLAHPLVVEVRDQFGDPLPNAAVTFKVTGGEGQLSGRYSVEHTTTDAKGRAELLLTLGPQPGPNIVGVSLGGGHELATFTAQGVGTAVAELEGDYRTWHLPRAATVRLGKGVLGEGDRTVALSADGRCLAVASAIGVWLYETATSRALALLPTERPAHSVAFSLDGTLAAGLGNGQVKLWEVETGERIGTLRHPEWGRVAAVVFSPDGTRLASGSWDQVIKVWDVETRRVTGTWEVPRETENSWAISVDFSLDGTRLASGFQDGTVRLWDVASQTEVATLEGHTDRVASVAFSPDGALLASAGSWDDRTVILWNAATEAQVATLRGHTNQVRSVAFSSPDGATLASGSSEGTVRLWDVATHQEVATLEEHGGPVHSVTFSRDGSTLVSGAADGTVLLRELETGNVAGLSGHGSLSTMALSADGTLLASGSYDGTVRLWDAATRNPIATLEGHARGVPCVSFSADGSLLASGSWDRTVKLWEVRTREPVGTLEGHSGGVTSVAFSPDGATLASAGGWNDATVRLWDVGARALIGSLEGHTKEVLSVAFSPPGGAFLASAGGDEDKTVKLWDVANQQLIATLEGHENGVYTVAFSPDGNILASVSWDGTRLWSVTTREPIGNLEGARGRSAAFSPDGKSLVSGSWGTVSLWDMMTKRRTANLQGHTDLVHSVAFTRDGATLASGASDGTMLLWNLGPHPRTLTKVPGRRQQGPAGTVLDRPFFVLVLDQYGDPLAGATVTFRVTAGGGTLSVTTATTDAEGRAATTLTLGSQPGTNTVVASVKDVEPATFTATAKSDPDFDGDGTVGFSDFVLFAAKFGLSQGDDGYDVRYDLDGNGAIGFSDFLIFAQAFGKEG